MGSLSMSDDQVDAGKTALNIIDIIKHQRNRYPVLLIDKVEDLQPGKSAVGIKNFTYNEWFFPGHFDDEPNVPGFIQVEALVQAFILTFLSMPEYSGMKTNFTNIDNVKFKRKIIPGDTLRSFANLRSFKRGLAKGDVAGFVNDELAVSADLTIIVPDVFNKFFPNAKNAK
jgi:3-hydroxyacyl-[acyl-carrier-protein] dehydratase